MKVDDYSVRLGIAFLAIFAIAAAAFYSLSNGSLVLAFGAAFVIIAVLAPLAVRILKLRKK